MRHKVSINHSYTNSAKIAQKANVSIEGKATPPEDTRTVFNSVESIVYYRLPRIRRDRTYKYSVGFKRQVGFKMTIRHKIDTQVAICSIETTPTPNVLDDVVGSKGTRRINIVAGVQDDTQGLLRPSRVRTTHKDYTDTQAHSDINVRI